MEEPTLSTRDDRSPEGGSSGAEDDGRALLALMREIFDRLPVILTIADPVDGTQRMVNAAGAALLGYEETGPVADGWDYVHPEDLPALAELHIRMRVGREARPVRFRARAADGSWRRLEAVAVDATDVPGVRGTVVLSRDVSEDVERAELLAEETEHLHETIEALGPGVLVEGPDGTCRLATARLVRLLDLGTAPGDMVHRPCAPVMDEIEARLHGDPPFAEWARSAVLSGIPSRGRRFTLGDGRGVLVDVVPLGTEGGAGRLWSFALEPDLRRGASHVSETTRSVREQAETRAREEAAAQQARAEVAGAIHADLSPPVEELTQAVAALADPSARLEAAEAIRQAVEELRLLVDDLGRLTRPQADADPAPHVAAPEPPRARPRVLMATAAAAVGPLLREAMRRNGLDLSVVGGADHVRAAVRDRDADIVVLHGDLEDASLPEVLAGIRAMSVVPVVVVTPEGDDGASLRALGAGADDVVTPSVGASVLAARLQALLRRVAPPPSVYRDRRLTIDYDARRVVSDGAEVQLTATEWRLLTALVGRPGATYSAGDLLEVAWADPRRVGPDRVKFAVLRLRRRLGWSDVTTSPIETVRGSGYRYRPPA